MLNLNFIKFKKLKNKLFNKKQYKIINTNKMSETKEATLKFQWKKGENFGKIVEVESQDDKFYHFTDGSKIFKEVATEFLEQFTGNNIPFPGADQAKVGINTNKTTPQKSNQKPKTTHTATPTPPTSELHGLISKLSKKNLTPFKPTINLNIPNNDIFNMLIENSDENEEELIETITEVALSQIEINKLQTFLKQEITNFLNNYYNE